MFAFKKLVFLILVFFALQATLASSQAITPLSAEAQETLRQGGQAAALALATYDEHFIDKPLWRDAVNYGLQLQKQAPDNPQTYRFLGQVYSSISFYSRAWNAWERYKALGGEMTAQTAPYLSEVSSWLGNKSFLEGDYDKAILYYGALYDLEPQSEEANQHIALSHLELGDTSTAMPYLKTLTTEYPNKADYANILSRTVEQSQFGFEATQLFYEGLDLYASGEKTRALETLTRASVLGRDYRKAVVWAGRISEELGLSRQSERLWEQALDISEDDEAMAALERAKGQNQYGFEAFNTFQAGLNYYLQGQRGEAIWSFQKASQLNPSYAEAWGWLGQMSVEAGDFNSALRHYETARSLEPGKAIFEAAYNETSRLLAEQAPRVTTQPSPPPTAAPSNAVAPEVQGTTISSNPLATSPTSSTATNQQSPPPTNQAVTTTPTIVTEPNTTITSSPPEPQVAEPQLPIVQATPTSEPVSEPITEPIAEIALPQISPQANVTPTASITTEPSVNVSAATSIPNPQTQTTVSPRPLQDAPSVSTPSGSNPVITSTVAPPVLTPRPTPSLEPVVATPVAPAPAPVSTAPALTLISINHTHESADKGGTGAFSFFDTPSSLLGDLTESGANYAGGTLHQQISIASKPSGEPVKYQVCLVHNDDLSIGPACTTSNTLIFEEPGVYEISQAMVNLSNHADIDWSRGLQQIMLIVQDKDGNTIDNRVAFQTDDGTFVDLANYYPMQVKYSAIIVPEGGTFPGWP